MPGWRKCGGCARRTSTRTRARTRNERQLVPGRSWAAWARALGHLLPPLRVADLGCGEGYLTIEASRWASRVIAVDRSPAVLERARALATRRRVRNVIWKRGELEKLPLRDAQRRRRAAVAGAAPRRAIRRARSPKPRASSSPAAACWCSICASTTRTWVRERLGDRWLGFSDEALAKLLAERRPRPTCKSTSARGAPAIRSPCSSRAARSPARGNTSQDEGRRRISRCQNRLDRTQLRPSRRALEQRVLMLDGAMGTMIQRYKLTEADFRGERFTDHPHDLQGQQRPAGPDASRRHRRDPSRVSRRRRRHHRDQHLHEHGDRAGRLRARVARLRAERRRRAARARGGRRVDGEDARPAALRRRLASARRTGRCRSRPTSTTRRSAA